MLSSFLSISLEEVNSVSISLDEFTNLMTEKMALRDEPEKLRDAFMVFDVEGKGYVTYRDFKRVSREIDVELSEDELTSIMAHIDKDCGGRVTFEEWQRLFIAKTK